MHGCGRTVWFSSYLGCHAWISSFTLTLRCFSSDSDNCFHVWVGPLVQFPHPPRAPSNTPVFLSSSFLLSSFALVYIFSSTGQVLLPPLSWCSAYTSVSEGGSWYMLSRLVIAFLPRSKSLLISWLQAPSAVILEPPQNKVCHCFHCSPSICHMKWWEQMPSS